MRIVELNRISKNCFGVEDIAETLGITHDSAKVTASRYVQKKLLIRLKKNLYVLAIKFPTFSSEELFAMANLMQTPSYVSLTTALAYHNLTGRQTRGYIESIALKRTKTVTVENTVFSFTRIQKSLYSDFELNDGFFIAKPEKAITDCIYLSSMKRYNCDFDAIDFNRINPSLVDQNLKKADRRVRVFWEKLCVNYSL